MSHQKFRHTGIHKGWLWLSLLLLATALVLHLHLEITKPMKKRKIWAAKLKVILFIFLLPAFAKAQSSSDTRYVNVSAIGSRHAYGFGATINFLHENGNEAVGFEAIKPVHNPVLLPLIARVELYPMPALGVVLGAGYVIPRNGALAEAGLTIRWRQLQSIVTYRYFAFHYDDATSDDGTRLSGIWLKAGVNF